MIVNWYELKPGCYGILDILQFTFLRAFSGLPYCGWDPIPEYMGMAKRKEYAPARKIAWIMAANIKEKENGDLRQKEQEMIYLRYSHIGQSYDSWRNNTITAMRDKIAENNEAVVRFTVLGDKLKAFRARHGSHVLYKPKKRLAVQKRLDELAFEYQAAKLAVCSADAVIRIHKEDLNIASMKHYGRRISREIKTAKNAVMLCSVLKLLLQNFEREVREIDALMESIKTGRP